MASRTQIVCLCEGRKDSIDAVFINALMNTLRPGWVRKIHSNWLRPVPCGGRTAVVERMPEELRNCLKAGSDTTLMVWADCDDTCADGATLKDVFWREAQRQQITQAQFDHVVFIFAKDRIENWIEFLNSGNTDESKEGPRVKHGREAAESAKKLANHCKAGKPVDRLPPSLQWSCRNWRALAERMRS